ncbi:class A beta-lactamase [Nonomuraea sp. NPDC052265]|uniref:class A beta-lactamase n=1 Tax=Nonomuraea sp. NPDC052265 TaxID=3364374 RepID=UPI0037C51840
MSYEQSRRALLRVTALLPLAACGTGVRRAAEPPASPSAASPPASSAAASPAAVTPSARPTADVRLAALERRHGARLGVYALDTGTGTTLAHRADERFAFCSTFKALAAAAVLHRKPLSHLDDRVTFTGADVNSFSPITQHHVADGMTVRQLCDAAIRYSDGTAGNLLMRDIGGPARLTAFLRGLGDTVSRVDHYEPELNRMGPKNPRDTTTPRAIAADYREILLGDVLPPAKRALLEEWLRGTTTGTARIRAGLPKGWKLAHKTGTGDYGRANDIAVVWPPGGAPLVVAVMSDRPGYGTPPEEALIAEATRVIVHSLT